jgi:transcriptional regulator with GAF, ATPase, and Fis domain
MEDTSATRLVTKSDGSECLLLRRARLCVTKGPDKGLDLPMTKTRVRIGSGPHCDLCLTDSAVSREHLELRATESGYLLKDLNSTNGTFVGSVRLQRALLTQTTVLTLGSSTLRLEPSDQTIEIPLSRRGRFGNLLGQSTAMRQVFAQLESVAQSEATVLLEGESGTGKELAAAGIHLASPRRDRPLVILDCGAIPASLVESELFGHERGAFTGADQQRAGALEQADGGTLFLDEVGELPLSLQPRLLRFLENRQVKRLGATRHLRVDARVIAATNRSLNQEVQQGRFREDLYFRLSVMQIELPPLRERPEDILLLAYHFTEPYVADPQELITDEISGLLTAYDWPGNARELRNMVERLAITPEQARQMLRQQSDSQPPAEVDIDVLADLPFHEARQRWQDRFERRYLEIQLERAGDVVSRAASRAQLPRQTMHRLLKRQGLRR